MWKRVFTGGKGTCSDIMENVVMYWRCNDYGKKDSKELLSSEQIIRVRRSGKRGGNQLRSLQGSKVVPWDAF